MSAAARRVPGLGFWGFARRLKAIRFPREACDALCKAFIGSGEPREARGSTPEAAAFFPRQFWAEVGEDGPRPADEWGRAVGG
jgi:hypothetical protein